MMTTRNRKCIQGTKPLRKRGQHGEKIQKSEMRGEKDEQKASYEEAIGGTIKLKYISNSTKNPGTCPG